MTDFLLQLYFGAEPARDGDRVLSTAEHLRDGRLRDGTTVTEEDSTAIDLARARAIRAGDASAFSALVTDHLTALVRFAASFVHSRDAAEDVVQDVLAQLWSQRVKIPVTGSVRAFLFTAVRNRALNALKHSAVESRAYDVWRRATTDRTRDNVIAASIDDADAETRAMLARVHAGIAALPERQRTALALRYGQSLKVAEVAMVLGVSVKAAEQLLIRALRTLRAMVSARPPGESPSA